MNESKVTTHKKNLGQYELMFFDELEFTIDTKAKAQAKLLHDNKQALDQLSISLEHIFVKTDKDFYVSYLDVLEHKDNTTMNENTRLRMSVLKDKTISTDLVIIHNGRYSSYYDNEESTILTITSDEVEKMVSYLQTIQYFNDIQNKAHNKLEKENSKISYYPNFNEIDQYTGNDVKMFITMKAYINGHIILDKLKEDFRVDIIKDIKENLDRINEKLEEQSTQEEQEKQVDSLINTREYSDNKLEFNDKVITFLSSDTKFEFTKSFPIYNRALVFDEEELDRVKEHNKNITDDDYETDISDDLIFKLTESGYYSGRNPESLMEKVIATKNDVTITKDTNTLKVEFINGRCKVNDFSINKQFFKKVYNEWRNDQTIDVEETINRYKLLGVRKQLVVDEINKVRIQNLGQDQKEFDINFEVIPIDKNKAKVNFLNMTSVVDWTDLTNKFVCGNRVGSKYIGLAELIKFGFPKKDVLEHLKNYVLLSEI